MRPGWLAAVALLVACGGSATQTATPSPTAPAPSPTAAYDYPDDLAVGQCFDPIYDKDDDSLLAARLRSCDEPHLLEVFARNDIDDAADEPFPGDSALDPISEKKCLDSFLEYVGIAFDESALSATYYQPSKETWLGGDRLILCVIEGSDVAPLTKSAKGSRS